ncbi:MAG: helix-turn-helix domain-containing protein [Alphaproteobacteria bacterium]|nr:helix-turn-helix domain-containing protein [Alphaproteobacteria bacterium]
MDMQFEIEHRGATAVFQRDELVLVNGSHSTRLTERQAILLQMLCTMPDRCISRSDFAWATTGREWDPSKRLPLDQHIHALRSMGLEIVSIRGVGYALRGTVRRLDEAAEMPRPQLAAPHPGPDVDGGAMPVWLDDCGRLVIASPDHDSHAKQILGLPDAGAITYLLARPGFVQLFLGTGRLHAVYDDQAVSPAAIRGLHDQLSIQSGCQAIKLETTSGRVRHFDNVAEALLWLDRTHQLSDHLAPGSVIEEVMDPERCQVPEITTLLKAWRSGERAAFYDSTVERIRRARGRRAQSAPVHRVLCVEKDRDGEPVYADVGPGILMYGANSALYLRGRRVRDQAAPGYARYAAEHYLRAMQSEHPTLATIRSTVQLAHGVRTLAHLRLSLPVFTSGGRKRAVVARTVKV